MISLAYLNIPVSKLKVYVTNRVSNIHRLTKKANIKWLHCSSTNNPSDLSCRGLSPDQLLNNSLWFNGPEILRKYFPPCDITPNIDDRNNSSPDIIHEALPVFTPEPNNIFSLSEKYSSFSRLQRVVGCILRFIKKL